MAKPKWRDFPHADKAYDYAGGRSKRIGRGCTGAIVSLPVRRRIEEARRGASETRAGRIDRGRRQNGAGRLARLSQGRFRQRRRSRRFGRAARRQRRQQSGQYLRHLSRKGREETARDFSSKARSAAKSCKRQPTMVNAHYFYACADAWAAQPGHLIAKGAGRRPRDKVKEGARHGAQAGQTFRRAYRARRPITPRSSQRSEA